jgi:hypothetical protein
MSLRCIRINNTTARRADQAGDASGIELNRRIERRMGEVVPFQAED